MQSVKETPTKVFIISGLLFVAGLIMGTTTDVGKISGVTAVSLFIFSYYLLCANYYECGRKISALILCIIPLAPTFIISQIIFRIDSKYFGIVALIGYIIISFIIINIIIISKKYIIKKRKYLYIDDDNLIYKLAILGFVIGIALAYGTTLATATGGGTSKISYVLSETTTDQQFDSSHPPDDFEIKSITLKPVTTRQNSYNPYTQVYGTIKNNGNHHKNVWVALWAYDRNKKIVGNYRDGSQGGQQLSLYPGEEKPYSIEIDIRILGGDPESKLRISIEEWADAYTNR